MGVLDEKPRPFRKGRHVSASALEMLRNATPRSIQGDGGVNVQQYGDRTTISLDAKSPILPSVANYLQRFVVVEEGHDLLKCVPFWAPPDPSPPNKPIQQVYDSTLGSAATTFVYVAKPYYLQKAPWDGVTIPAGTEHYTFSYPAIGLRIATGVLPTVGVIDQLIYSRYLPGDVIAAYKTLTALYDPDNAPVMWQDANEAGRHWATETESDTDSDCCTLAGLRTTDCLSLKTLSAGGTCDCGDSPISELLTYSAGAYSTGVWTGANITICGRTYTPIFDITTGIERLGLQTTGSGGGTIYYGIRSCCYGSDCIEFVFGGELFCTGDPNCPPDLPSVNTLRLIVCYAVCPNPDYFGPGWYCVDATTCVHYLTDPGLCANITAGPFASQADCLATCGGGPPPSAPCQGRNFLLAKGYFTDRTLDCVCLPDEIDNGSVALTDQATFTPVGCPGTVALTLDCHLGQYRLVTGTGGVTITLLSFSAGPPLVLSYSITGYGANCGGAGGSARFTIVLS